MNGRRASDTLRRQGITPDEAQMLVKRHHWREKVLDLCLQHLTEEPDCGAGSAPSVPGDGAGKRFESLCSDIRRDMPRLLQTELGVPVLEAHRHAANYFLDHLIVFVRERSERRSRDLDSPPSPPLESLAPEMLRQEVRLALEMSAESLTVFLNDLVALEEFELEVRNQRRRLQFFLGCDRGLRDLAETNAEIIEAPPDELASIVEEFFRICSLLQHELPPLLDTGSPFPRLAAELEAARDQLDRVLASSIEPLYEVRSRVEALQEGLRPLLDGLLRVKSQLEGIWRGRLPGFGVLLAGDQGRAQRARLQRDLVTLERTLRALAQKAVPAARERLAASQRKDLERVTALAESTLAALEGELQRLVADGVAPVADFLARCNVANQALQRREEVSSLLADLFAQLRRLHEGSLRDAIGALDELGAANLLLLKERICQELGSIRSTFLQPRFAHIAANDPRSTQTPQYFYFKEFADEATRSQELLHCVDGLWRFVEQIQETHIDGLRFTPRNLNRIARRVLLERRSVPAGPGWRELAGFLEALKGKLAPRLQQVCGLPGIRFDDRNQLAVFAEELTRSCSELLAQRETAKRLVQELERLAGTQGVETPTHGPYREAVLRVTCEEMAQKLRLVSRTLLELVPYVGAMIGGIRMRTSLAFTGNKDASS
jgi:hypothetical protein